MNKKWFLFSLSIKQLRCFSETPVLLRKTGLSLSSVRSPREFRTGSSLEKNVEFCTQNDFERNLLNELELRPERQDEHLPTLNDEVGLLKKNQSEYKLETFVRSNQDTCLTHKPSVVEGDWVQSGDFLTDCANSVGGELSLGQNIFIAYMPWEGYNFEDAILISERLVTDDLFTSVHIERYEIENLQKNRPPVKAIEKKAAAPRGESVRKTLRRKKLQDSLSKTSLRKNPLETNGISKSITKKSKSLTPPKIPSTNRTPRYEEITRNIPDVSPIELSNLDAFGIVKLGSFVEEGDILVGKISPINKKDFTPYQKLLYTILNKQILPYRDSSLRAPKGIKAKVIDIKIFMKPGTVSYSSKVLQNNHSILIKKRNKTKTLRVFAPSRFLQKRLVFSEKLNLPEKRKRIPEPKFPGQKKNLNKKYMLSTLIKRTSLSAQAPATNNMRSFLLNSSNLSFLDTKSIPLHSISSVLAKKTNKINNSLVESSSLIKTFLSTPLVAKKSSFSNNLDGDNNSNSFCEAVMEKPTTSLLKESSPVLRSKTGVSIKERSSFIDREAHENEVSVKGLSTVSANFTKNTKYFNINKYEDKLMTLFRRKSVVLTKTQKLAVFVENGEFSPGNKVSGTKVSVIHKKKKSNRGNFWLSGLAQNRKKSFLVQIANSRSATAEGLEKLKNLYKNDIFLEKHPLLKQEQLYDSQSIENIETIHIYLAEKRKVQVGDKMSGRHGNKGIVSQILPVQDMPFLPDGTPIDMVLNPLGVPSRMNVGQIYECLLGLAGRYLGENYKIFAFDEIYGAEASRSFVFNKLYEASCKTGFKWLFNPKSPGKIRLFDGRSGDCFDQPVTVGQAYMLRLVHMVDDKIHMRSTGPYSLVTQQPLRGRSKQGGQRLGEMEVWALEGYGAAFTLLEMLTVKSDDLTGRMTLWSNLILNKDLTIGTPEAFKVLICELQALCLDIGLFRYNTNNDIIIKKDQNKTLEEKPLLQSRQKKSLKEMTSLMSFP